MNADLSFFWHCICTKSISAQVPRPLSRTANRILIVRFSSRPLVVALAVVAGWVLFGPSARADYICSPAGLGSEGVFGASDFASDDAMPSDRDRIDDSPTQVSRLLLPSPLSGPSTQAGTGGAGAPSGSGTGGSASPAGLFIRLPLPTLQQTGRYNLSYLAYHPPPFPKGVFHPPRSA